MRMPPGRQGPEGWYTDELKQLPKAAIAELTSPFQKCESEGEWPACQLFSYAVLIPKPDAANKNAPDQQRPINVLPVLYRVWASAIGLG